MQSSKVPVSLGRKKENKIHHLLKGAPVPCAIVQAVFTKPDQALLHDTPGWRVRVGGEARKNGSSGVSGTWDAIKFCQLGAIWTIGKRNAAASALVKHPRKLKAHP